MHLNPPLTQFSPCEATEVGNRPLPPRRKEQSGNREPFLNSADADRMSVEGQSLHRTCRKADLEVRFRLKSDLIS